MKFVNREFGIEWAGGTGRPSENDKPQYPLRSVVGFGLDGGAPNGMLIAGELGTVWGLKFSYQRAGRWVTDNDFINEPARYIADGGEQGFRYICHDALTVSMVKYSKNAAVLSVSALVKCRIRFQFYSLTAYDSILRAGGKRMSGVANERAIIKGDTVLSDDKVSAKGRYEVIYDESSARKEYAVAEIVSGAEDSEITASPTVLTCEAVIDETNPRVTVYFAVGNQTIENDIPSAEELNRGVNNAELKYSADKFVGSGPLVDAGSDIVSLCAAHKIYNPLRLSNYYIEDRTGFDYSYCFNPFGLSAGGLVSALIDDTAKDQVEAYAGEVVLGALSAWIAFCRTRDKEILAKAFPNIVERWGSVAELERLDPISKREIAYKMPFSPLKNVKHETLYPMDYNAYKLIAFEVLAKAARILKRADAAKWQNTAVEFASLYRKTFFNETLGLFMDRYASGEFTSSYGGLSFLPLITNAVDDNDTLDKLLINLFDSSKFRTDYFLTTLSKNNYAYGKKNRRSDGSTTNQYEDYTGSILPSLNYLVYLGLQKQGVAEAAAGFAESSTALWNKYFAKNGAVPSIALPNIKTDKSATKDSVSGNLFGLIGISELLDVEYWRSDLRPSIRFGTFAAGEHRLANYKLFGRTFGITVTKRSTELTVDGVTALEGVGGAFIIRNFTETEDGLSFMIYAKTNITFTVRCPVFTSGEKATYRFNIESGRFLAEISSGKIKVRRLA